MSVKSILDDLSAKIGDTLDNSPVKDVEKNVKSMLGSAFNRMDLVTREEFDIQQQVLLKTREKLTALERRVAELETLMASGEETVVEEIIVESTDSAADTSAAS